VFQDLSNSIIDHLRFCSESIYLLLLFGCC